MVFAGRCLYCGKRHHLGTKIIVDHDELAMKGKRKYKERTINNVR
jgi:hypothetical protein|tara:strand:- start:2327 stop:2461 length:135 start_codon:yes stop_codon:yes gene_type:complete